MKPQRYIHYVLESNMQYIGRIYRETSDDYYFDWRYALAFNIIYSRVNSNEKYEKNRRKIIKTYESFDEVLIDFPQLMLL